MPVPRHIYSTWRTKDLPPKMGACYKSLRARNPEFEFHLYDDRDCLHFISDHFDESVRLAYNNLVPGDFRADLWRYCVLYLCGGIYMDIRFCTVDGVRMEEYTIQESYFVRDLRHTDAADETGIFNGFMACAPGNAILLSVIHQIVYHCHNGSYGGSPLHITGPLLLGRYFTEEEKNGLSLSLSCPDKLHCIKSGANTIAVEYPEYRREQAETSVQDHCEEMWRIRRVFQSPSFASEEWMMINTTMGTPGRFGNQFIRNLCLHLIAERDDLCFEYAFRRHFRRLGVELFSGKTTYAYGNHVVLDDANICDYLHHQTSQQKNVVITRMFAQCRLVSSLLFNHFSLSSVRENVMGKNPHRDRYGSNDEVFVHVRLGDVPHLNPGPHYYDYALSQMGVKRGGGFLSSDSIGHPTCRYLIRKYGLTVHDEGDEVETVQFASTCGGGLVLSNGTFSWVIGLLAFATPDNRIFYPQLTTRWHGDIYVPGRWREIKTAEAVPSTSRIDVVVPLGPKDVGLLKLHLKSILDNIVERRHIFLVVASDVNDPMITGPINELGEAASEVTVLHETIFPFNPADVSAVIGRPSRNGWYLQQLIKLYAGLVIQGLSSRYLVVDADTFFLRPTRFFDQEGRCLFTPGTEHHGPYFHHMRRLHESLMRRDSKSGISHHMVFDTLLVSRLFDMVEERHGKTSPFWKIFLQKVDEKEKERSGASEYEVYYAFVRKYHASQTALRTLKWKNTSSLTEDEIQGMDFVSYHWYRRKRT